MLHEKSNKNLSILEEIKTATVVTKESIKNYDGFENLSEDEAQLLVITIETYCEVLLNQVQRNIISLY